MGDGLRWVVVLIAVKIRVSEEVRVAWMSHFIFDLRLKHGGLVHAAIEVGLELSEFMSGHLSWVLATDLGLEGGSAEVAVATWLGLASLLKLALAPLGVPGFFELFGGTADSGFGPLDLSRTLESVLVRIAFSDVS